MGASDDLGQLFRAIFQEVVAGLVEHDQRRGRTEQVPLPVALLVVLGDRIAFPHH
jgi:hypothetical protein